MLSPAQGLPSDLGVSRLCQSDISLWGFNPAVGPVSPRTSCLWVSRVFGDPWYPLEVTPNIFLPLYIYPLREMKLLKTWWLHERQPVISEEWNKKEKRKQKWRKKWRLKDWPPSSPLFAGNCDAIGQVISYPRYPFLVVLFSEVKWTQKPFILLW